MPHRKIYILQKYTSRLFFHMNFSNRKKQKLKRLKGAKTHFLN